MPWPSLAPRTATAKETHLAPRRDGADLAALNDAEGTELVTVYLQIFSILRAPNKLKYLAGSESGMGAWISDTAPEKIADRLNEVAS